MSQIVEKVHNFLNHSPTPPAEIGKNLKCNYIDSGATPLTLAKTERKSYQLIHRDYFIHI